MSRGVDGVNPPGPTAAYGLSLAAVVVAGVARGLLDPVLGDHLPFFTLYFATIFSAWYGGFRPGVLSLVLGIGCGTFFFIEPRLSFSVGGVAPTFDILRFAGVGLAVSLICESLHRSRRRSEDQREVLRVTLASIGDAVITTDTDGRITGMNPVAETLTAWGTAEAAGRPLEAVFRIVNEETRQPVENPAARALREGSVVGLANHTVLIARDDTERAIDDSAAPIRDGQGRVTGCVLVFRDVTGQRRAEQALHRSEERLRLLADTIPQLAWMARPDGHIFWFNRRCHEFTGRTTEQLEGWGWQSLLDPDGAARVLDGWRGAIASGEPFDMTFPLRGADGRFRLFLTRVNPCKGEGGRTLYWCGTNTDISDIKRLEGALRDADRRKDEFLATLAHELRNPLAPIRNALQVMRLAGRTPEAVEQARGMIERQVSQMVRLVDDLLDVSRITTGKVELRKAPVQLAAVVSGAVETSRPLVEQMGHELTVTLPEPHLVVDADFTRLAQVFVNLLNNAAKYTERGGRIWLTAERQGSDVVVAVRDTGVGIAADQLPRIFDMFSQVARSLERSQGGLGVGLSLVRRLVEMHDGRIEARSAGPGRGSEFVVRLPVVVEASVPPPAERPEPAAPKSSLRILIVDDNRDGADSLGMMLRIMGNDTRTAYDGQDGVDAAGEFRPDVILLDIGLPRLNGYEACRRIRGLPWGTGVVLVAVTGWGQEEDRRRSHEAGFDRHLVKPVDPQALMKLLAELNLAKV